MAKKRQRKRPQRLADAQKWLPGYEGKNIVKGYRKRYGVDLATAFKELEMLGLEFDPARKEQALRSVQEQAEARRRRHAEREARQMMSGQKQRRGHYCHVCCRYRANEKFSGKGHARHICKDCERERRRLARQRRKRSREAKEAQAGDAEE
jgi:hypothetical protein